MSSTDPRHRDSSTLVAGALTIAGALAAVLAALTLPPVAGVAVGVALAGVGLVARRDQVPWVLPVTCWVFGALCVVLAVAQGVRPGS